MYHYKYKENFSHITKSCLDSFCATEKSDHPYIPSRVYFDHLHVISVTFSVNSHAKKLFCPSSSSPTSFLLPLHLHPSSSYSLSLSLPAHLPLPASSPRPIVNADSFPSSRRCPPPHLPPQMLASSPPPTNGPFTSSYCCPLPYLPPPTSASLHPSGGWARCARLRRTSQRLLPSGNLGRRPLAVVARHPLPQPSPPTSPPPYLAPLLAATEAIP